MIHWTKIVHLGDSVIVIPVAVAIFAYFAAGRAWRIAWYWSLLFILCISLVAATKIAFLGWGTGIHSVNFKALSGHATTTSVVAPVSLYLLLQRFPPMIRTLGAMLGIVLGILMGVLLIVLNEHTASEVITGCIIGGFASLIFIRFSGPFPSFNLRSWLIPFCLFVFVAIWYVEPPPVEYWLRRLALTLSGHETTYNWATWEPDTS